MKYILGASAWYRSRRCIKTLTERSVKYWPCWLCCPALPHSSCQQCSWFVLIIIFYKLWFSSVLISQWMNYEQQWTIKRWNLNPNPNKCFSSNNKWSALLSCCPFNEMCQMFAGELFTDSVDKHDGVMLKDNIRIGFFSKRSCCQMLTTTTFVKVLKLGQWRTWLTNRLLLL